MVAVDFTAVRPRARASSFELFMECHCGRLVQALTMISLDREVAADAAQEAFIQLYLRWDRVEEYRDPVAWVYRVGINRCKDYRRFLSRTARVVERLGSQRDQGGGGNETVEWTPDLDFATIFRSLPRRQRTAATLYYLNDLSIGEIARIMGISEGAVNSHLHRAREALKGLVEAG
jgi:RNA polymerase sigma-70 factor (ECF subfamily)